MRIEMWPRDFKPLISMRGDITSIDYANKTFMVKFDANINGQKVYFFIVDDTGAIKDTTFNYTWDFKQ